MRYWLKRIFYSVLVALLVLTFYCLVISFSDGRKFSKYALDYIFLVSGVIKDQPVKLAYQQPFFIVLVMVTNL